MQSIFILFAIVTIWIVAITVQPSYFRMIKGDHHQGGNSNQMNSRQLRFPGSTYNPGNSQIPNHASDEIKSDIDNTKEAASSMSELRGNHPDMHTRVDGNIFTTINDLNSEYNSRFLRSRRVEEEEEYKEEESHTTSSKHLTFSPRWRIITNKNVHHISNDPIQSSFLEHVDDDKVLMVMDRGDIYAFPDDDVATAAEEEEINERKLDLLQSSANPSNETPDPKPPSDINQSQLSQIHLTHHFQSLNEPTTHGWTPDVFPNPSQTPEQCGISQLLQASDNNHHQQLFGNNPLLLCDPDSILGKSSLAKVASAVQNFTVGLYSHATLPCDQLASESGDHARMQTKAKKTHDKKISLLSPLRLGAGLLDLFDDHENKNDSSSISENNSASEENDQSDESIGKDDLSWSFGDVADSFDENNASFSIPNTESVRSAPIQIAVAVVNKINLQAVLRADSYYSYEDEDDMINDAAQYFARYLHDSWAVGSAECGQTGILIFLSIMDRVCFISTGAAVVPILPWWRLERVVTDMKPDLRRKNYGEAILQAINDISFLLEEGPPTFTDRINDFIERFGVVIAFALFTFLFAAWGEYRDRRKRWQYTEARSRLTQKEKTRAKMLQKEYRIVVCPICLENFQKDTSNKKTSTAKAKKSSGDDDTDNESESSHELEISDSDIPSLGSDGLPLKLLRCGHVFDESCWKCWINSGQGNPCICPVCRQDVGRNPNQNEESIHSNYGSTADRTQTNDNEPSINNQTSAQGEDQNQNIQRTRALRIWHMSNQYGTMAPINVPDIVTDESQGWPHLNLTSRFMRHGSSSMNNSTNRHSDHDETVSFIGENEA